MSLDPETKKLMEKLLLRGERMLGETCPVCGTPLFLIKEVGLRFCPKCKRYVITSEEEYNKALNAGIKPEDMIIVGFRPKVEEKKAPIERHVEKSVERHKKHHDAIDELLWILVDLVRKGKYEEARKVAEIIRIICSCL